MNRTWLKAAGTRALKTAAQTALGIIGAATVLGAVTWPLVFSGALLAAVVSLLTSIAGLPEID
ncbi:phage r1t holin [Micrococcales bacterium KH10]|nr:phage r1t holin [Micrococcales bacterium KH10]